jgi:hypothetical protein
MGENADMATDKKAGQLGVVHAGLGVGLLVAVGVIAGCASHHSGSGSGGGTGHASSGGPASSTAPLPQIMLQRSGGFAGLKDTVSVDPQGAWNVTNRAGTRSSGALTAEQLTTVRTLATDPRLADEAGRTRPPTRCRDAFTYQLTVGGTRIEYVDCPADPDQPTASIALAKAIVGYTISASAPGSGSRS